jgi:two-component system chemotaxis sensor kinase CheA
VAIDLERFHRSFFEESFEGLDTMEQALLHLDPGAAAADPEAINSVFRAAHSIKGGAATFGFAAVAGFTHHLETLLDRMRAGTRAVDPPVVDLLLHSVDAVRALLSAARDGAPADAERVAALEHELRLALDHSGPAAPKAVVPAAAAAAAPSAWRIRFVPQPQMFRSGNDPLRILRGLAELGELAAEADLSAAPAFAEAEAESCYFAWDLKLRAACTREDVQELFAWVEDECELTIEPFSETAQDEPAPPATSGAAGRVPAVPVPKPVLVPISQAGPPPRPSASAETSSIRVSTDKIDMLINLVGELVITQAMLAQHARGLDPVANERLLAGLSQLDHNTRRLQEAVMSTRMLPIDSVFSRFPRMLRDLAARLGKQLRLQTAGEATELDKSVIEKIADPLTHLVRNAVDHGIELPEARAAAGKDACGTLRLEAAHQGGQIVIAVIDDGRGLDRERILAKARERGIAVADNVPDSEVYNLIFAPGFSTAAEVTDVSGRGVGMDVVRKNIQALNGQVELSSSPGRGTRVTIRLPLTLAILDGMSIAVGSEVFIIPLNSVVESLQPQPEQIKSLSGSRCLLRVRDEYLPLLPLYQLFGLDPGRREPHHGIVVVLEAEGNKLALLVDDLLGQHQVVIKSLESNYRRVSGVSGATILGDGRVALILDVAEILRSTARAAAA